MENIVRKREIARYKQFLLFSQCFLPCMALYFHFKCTLKCCLQVVSIWTSLKICHLLLGWLVGCIGVGSHFNSYSHIMAVGDAYVFPGLSVLTHFFFPKPPTTFLTCFCRRESSPQPGIQTHNHKDMSPTRSPLSHWAGLSGNGIIYTAL